MKSNEKSILAVTCYGHFLSHFNMLVFPAVLLPLSAQFNMTMVDTLSLSFWMYLLFGISALPWGIAADRLGAKPLLFLFYIGAGICGLFAAASLDNPLRFKAALTGIGLFSGIYHPVGLGLIAKSIEKTSIGMAYNGMFGNLGLAAAPLTAGIINYFYGVVTVYYIVGIINILGVFFIAASRSNYVAVPNKKNTYTYAQSFLPFAILLFCMMLGGIIYRGTSVTLPAYFELSNGELFLSLERYLGVIGSNNVAATSITSIIYLLGMVGQYFGGRVGERFDLRGGYLVFHLITIPAAIGMAFTANVPLIFFALVHSFFLLGMQPIENTLVAKLAPPSLMSSAYGSKFILTFGVGALSVKLVEIVKTNYGFPYIYLTFSCISIILVAAIMVLMKKTSSVRT